MSKLTAIALLVFSTSCSVTFQDSVRSSGTSCSTSRFWYVSDLLLAAIYTGATASQPDMPIEAYAPTAILAGSAMIGRYKRNNCLEHRRTASPEEYAADRARDEAEAAARWEALKAVASQAAAQQQSQPRPSFSSSTTRSVTSSSSTTTTSQQPASREPDWYTQRNACMAECRRAYDAGVEDCNRRWHAEPTMSSDAQTAAAMAQSQCAGEKAGAMSVCNKGC